MVIRLFLSTLDRMSPRAGHKEGGINRGGINAMMETLILTDSANGDWLPVVLFLVRCGRAQCIARPVE